MMINLQLNVKEMIDMNGKENEDVLAECYVKWE